MTFPAKPASLPKLPAPTRISPTPATEQEQHQKNNQYGRHFSPLSI
jgi:hypothetical protein